MASLMFKGSGQIWTEKAININDHRRQKVKNISDSQIIWNVCEGNESHKLSF